MRVYDVGAEVAYGATDRVGVRDEKRGNADRDDWRQQRLAMQIAPVAHPLPARRCVAETVDRDAVTTLDRRGARGVRRDDVYGVAAARGLVRQPGDECSRRIAGKSGKVVRHDEQAHD